MYKQYIPLSKQATKIIQSRWYKSMIYYPSVGVYDWLNANISGQWYMHGHAKHEVVGMSLRFEYEGDLFFSDYSDKILYELTWMNNAKSE